MCLTVTCFQPIGSIISKRNGALKEGKREESRKMVAYKAIKIFFLDVSKTTVALINEIFVFSKL